MLCGHAGSRLIGILRDEEIEEEYFCNYEVNREFQEQFEATGLIIAGIGPQGEARAIELPGKRFYLATLFQPQLTSQASGQPHPLIMEYLRIASQRISANNRVLRSSE